MRRSWRRRLRARWTRLWLACGAFGLAVTTWLVSPAHGAARAAYFYHYMGADHLDSLALAGFDTAVIHWIPDSLGARGAAELAAYRARAANRALSLVPQWSLQQPSRLAARPAERRYTWGALVREAYIPCPLDTAYWRSALIDRADELLAAEPSLTRLAVDLELWQGGRHHWDAGPCRCAACVRDYRGDSPAPADPRRLSGLLGWEEGELQRRLVPLLAAFAARHPGVELGVFDLDYDSFAHRALARALARTGVPSADWSERTYGTGAADLPAVRQRLERLGHARTPVFAGLWLKRFRPGELPAVVKSLAEGGAGWFAFTTYSLWLAPERLTGPYTLSAPPRAYWNSLREANRP